MRLIFYLPYCNKTCLLHFPPFCKDVCVTSLESPGRDSHDTLGLKLTACMMSETKESIIPAVHFPSQTFSRHHVISRPRDLMNLDSRIFFIAIVSLSASELQFSEHAARGPAVSPAAAWRNCGTDVKSFIIPIRAFSLCQFHL